MNDFIPSLATLIAAFAGSWSAFYLQDNKERRKEKIQQVSSINQALFSLVRQYQSLENIKIEIAPFKEDKLRYINLPALSTNEFQDIKVKVETLNFLLDSTDPNLLMAITLEQDRFEMALKVIQLRSEFHIRELQTALTGTGIENGALLKLGDIRTRLGPRIADILINLTDQLYKHVYESSDSTLATLNRFYAYAKQTFPKEKFIKIADSA
jgi:hypothetical protein